jgi:hypothetical protein
VTNARVVYQALEQQAMILDDQNETELADTVREVLDVLWDEQLSSADRMALNQRGVVGPATEIYIEVRKPSAETTKLRGPVRAAAPPYLKMVGQ